MEVALSDFWKRYHTSFDEEDGSLPEVRFEDVADENLPRLFERLRSRAEHLSDAGFWDLEHGRDERVAAVPNAAALVAEGKAEGFHFLAVGAAIDGARLPEIGAFVLRGEFALDYQPGPVWDERTFNAFLALICELRQLAPEARVTTEPGVTDDYRAAFEREVAQYCDPKGAI